MQSMSCRGQRIEAYFGEAVSAASGHCDNCASGAAAEVAAISNTRTRMRHNTPPLVSPGTINVGEGVKHRRFGVGTVTAVDGQSVTVAFRRGEQTVRAGWLSSATPAVAAAA